MPTTLPCRKGAWGSESRCKATLADGWTPGRSPLKKTLILLLAGILVGSSLVIPAASAAVSAGFSMECDRDNHCVTGKASSSNGGVSITSISEGGQIGTAVAVCQGLGVAGAALIEITCSLGTIDGAGLESTMSFPGSAGAVPLATTTGDLQRRPVCWEVTGIFPTVLGSPHVVSTSDCAQLAL